MVKVKRRGLCFMLALYISACSVANSYASASVVIGGGVAVATEYAFAWLLGAVGLTAASVAVYGNADSIKAWGAQQNREFCSWVQENVDSYNEWADVTEDKINDWCDDLAKGTIRKGSDVWKAFKAWASSIYVRGGSVGGDINAVVGRYNGFDVICGMPSYFIQADMVSAMSGYSNYVLVTREGGWRYLLASSSAILLKFFGTDRLFVECNASCLKGLSYGNNYESHNLDVVPSGSIASMSGDYDVFISGNVVIDVNGNIVEWDSEDNDSYSYVGGASDVFDRDGSLDNLDLVGTESPADEEDIPVVWPGNDALADALAGLAAGAESWSQALENAGVVPVDGAGNTVVGDEGVTDEPIVGVPPSPPSVPTELKDYTVDGLSDLFPFCLPFDLIDFLGVLAAEPEAPHFTWTFSYPSLDGSMKTHDLEIDLSPFDSVAVLLRDMECILFVVGLILITRDQMIKG